MNQPVNSLYKSLDFFARQTVEGFITGMHKSPFQGFSVEFAEHRVYNPGETTRHIDWKLFARTDNLYVKRYDEETNLRAHLLLDTSTSMYYPNANNSKIDFSLKAIAVLSLLLKKQRDAFGLTCFSDQIEWQTPVRSSEGHYQELLQHLSMVANSKPNPKKTDLVKMLHLMAEKIKRRSLVMLFSDMFDSFESLDKLFDAFNHLKFKKHEIIIFHTVAAKEEIDFDFTPGPYKFVDPESGAEFKVNAEDVRNDYLVHIKEFNKVLKEKCLQYKIEFVEADIYKGFDQIMLPFLVKRQKLF
jgi:hypothetical protein